MKNKIVLLLLVFLIIFSAGYSLAFDCETSINDQAGIFKDNDLLMQEIRNLQASGPVVKIVTTKNLGDAGNLDAYISRIQKECPSWQSPDNPKWRRYDIVIFAISMDEREAGIYHGENFAKPLNNQVVRIRTDFMNPNFRSGNFDRGFIDAMKETGRLITEYLRPPVTQSKQEPPVIVIEKGKSEPTDLSGLWNFLFAALGVVAVGAAIVFVSRGVKRRREDRESKLAARQKAATVKGNVNSYITELSDQITVLEAGVNTVSQKLFPEESEDLQNAFHKLKAEYENATIKNTNLSEDKTLSPDNEELSASQYDQIAESFGKIFYDLQEIKKSHSSLSQKVDEAERIIKNAPDTISNAEQAINSAAADVAKVMEAGYKTEKPETELEKARQSIAQAKACLDRREYFKAMTIAIETTKLAKGAALTAAGFAKRCTDLENVITQLKERIPQVKQNIIEGRTVFEKLEAVFALESWESVHGNGTEAVNRLNWSNDGLAAAAISVSMENQSWDKAEEIVSQANKWLDEAESFMRSLHARLAGLEVARKDAPKEIELAEKDILAAKDYIAQYDADVREELEHDLANVEKQLDLAKAELKKDKPDYSKIVRIAREVNKTADSVLASAREEHEAAEKLRLRAASAVRDAERTISKAKEYIEDRSSGSSDLSSEPEDLLEAARSLLTRAKAAKNLEDRVALAEEADQKASEAYKTAAEEVSEEEARSRRSSSWGSSHDSGFYFGGFSIGSSSSSGGGSSGSRFGGSGGGSSGFFSGGGGGGSSGKW